MTPSWINIGEEAACPDCRDVGWIGRPYLPPLHGNDLVWCPSCMADEDREWRLKATGIPEVRRSQTLEAFRTEGPLALAKAHAAAIALADGGTKPWLILTGPKGSGKTHLLRGIALRRVAHGLSARYWRAAELEALWRSTQTEASPIDLAEVMVALTKAPALLIDDLFAQQASDWVLGQWEDLLDRRYDLMLPTAVATNLPPSEIAALSGRLASRFSDSQIVTWIDMQGVPDYRRRPL